MGLTPDGKTIISAYDTWHEVWVWDAESGQLLYRMGRHTDWVNDVGTSPDGHFGFSISNDATLRVWDLANGAPVATFTGEGPLKTCAVFPGPGLTVIAGEETGRVHLLQLRNYP